MPPVDHIKKFEVDPYTLQVESEGEEEQKSDAPLKAAGVEGNDEKKIMGASAWKIRKPTKPNQGNLRTGYEPIIAQRLQDNIISATIDVHRVDDDSQEQTPTTTKRKERESLKRTGTMPLESDS